MDISRRLQEAAIGMYVAQTCKTLEGKRLRPVLVHLWDGNLWVPTPGKFHQWGVSDGDTVAIVELADGEVIVLEPEEIKFREVDDGE